MTEKHKVITTDEVALAELSKSIRRSTLRPWIEKVQSYCFWWNQTHLHGHCLTVNQRLCTFCELVEAMEKECP